MCDLKQELTDLSLSSKETSHGAGHQQKKFVCDRAIKNIGEDELAKITDLMRGTVLSEARFLGADDDLQQIIQSDNETLAKHQLTKQGIIDTFQKLLTEMRVSVQNKSKKRGNMSTGFVREINDSANKMKAFFESDFLKEIMQNKARKGVHTVVLNDGNKKADNWDPEGFPNPFLHLPVNNPQWSKQYRRGALVPYNKIPYVVAEVVWNGAQTCPFQDPEDETHHGYEYGDRDYLIIAPGYDENGVARDMVQVISDLSLHMINNHDFWGKGVFRVDPIKFANLLGIGPNPIESPIEVGTSPGPSGQLEME